MYRRNCRPNTIRTNSGNIILFLAFAKHLGKIQLETISREDISAFVEHEQDRGLAPTSVHSRLRTVYAFLNFLTQRDVLHPDLLKRKLRIKLSVQHPRLLSISYQRRASGNDQSGQARLCSAIVPASATLSSRRTN
jgi:site-specific recombinase XerD